MTAPDLTLAETAIDYTVRHNLPVFAAKLVKRADGTFDKKPLMSDWSNAASIGGRSPSS